MKKYLPEGWLIDSSENVSALKTLSTVQDAYQKGQILEGRALVCDASHNLIVDMGCMKGVIPREEGAIGIAEGTVRDIALISRVNKPVCFIITDFEPDEHGRPAAVLSRRKAQEQCTAEHISSLVPGRVLGARVTHLEPFGAFCDIGCGIVSLLPIDSISVSRISHPCERFCCNDDIRTVVKSIDRDGRVSLSHKELLGTWEENAARFKQGETVSGIVRSVEDYGVFVELSPNLAGLAEPHANVFVGQHASVYIKSIIPEKMKLKLIIIDSFDADYSPEPVEYYYQDEFLSHWRYSPLCCKKNIETVFSEQDLADE